MCQSLQGFSYHLTYTMIIANYLHILCQSLQGFSYHLTGKILVEAIKESNSVNPFKGSHII